MDELEEMQFKFGTPKQEIDEPSDFLKETEELTTEEEITEKDKERRERRYFSAFKLIVGCLVFLGVVYLIDVVASAWLNKSLSGITESIIEIIKTLLFTLSGYLFARKENGD